MTESLRVAEPFRYVRIYTGFGKKGRSVLENYRSMMEESDTHLALGKRPYQYGECPQHALYDLDRLSDPESQEK